MRFHDRRQAGRALAAKLRERQKRGELNDPVVLALPRGGVPVADEIARALDARLDVLVARKIGAPFQPEFGIGAIAGDDPPIYDQRALAMLGLTEEELAPYAERERAELRRREELYRHGRPAPDLAGRSVVLADDGMATGVTARAAVRWLRKQGPARVVIAVPVADAGAVRSLGEEADDVVCLYQPHPFQAVGLWYMDFDQTSDKEVIDILRTFDTAR